MQLHEVKIIPLEEVSDGEFAPYGQIMGREKGDPRTSIEVLKYWTRNADLGPDDEKVDCGLLVCNKRGRTVKYFERHPETSENFVPIEGECIFVMAPADNSKDKPDISRIKAFYLNGKLGVALHKGNWHWPPIPLGEYVKLVLVRKGKSLEPKDIVELRDLGIDELVIKL
jgi:ureidoglycolate lyase